MVELETEPSNTTLRFPLLTCLFSNLINIHYLAHILSTVNSYPAPRTYFYFIYLYISKPFFFFQNIFWSLFISSNVFWSSYTRSCTVVYCCSNCITSAWKTKMKIQYTRCKVIKLKALKIQEHFQKLHIQFFFRKLIYLMQTYS